MPQSNLPEPNLSALKKTVVITGASSGIGRSCVVRMSRAGWRVFATVRKPADREHYISEALPGVSPLTMDVEDPSSIAAAAAEVASQVSDSELAGLVNVAGIGMMRPMEYANARDL